MDKKEMSNLVKGIDEKIGKENSGLISDSIGILISDNEKMLENETNLKKEIEDLKSKNEKLISANSSLLQQVGQVSINENENENKSTSSSNDSDFSFYDCFDKSGKFIR